MPPPFFSANRYVAPSTKAPIRRSSASWSAEKPTICNSRRREGTRNFLDVSRRFHVEEASESEGYCRLGRPPLVAQGEYPTAAQSHRESAASHVRFLCRARPQCNLSLLVRGGGGGPCCQFFRAFRALRRDSRIARRRFFQNARMASAGLPGRLSPPVRDQKKRAPPTGDELFGNSASTVNTTGAFCNNQYCTATCRKL